MENINDNIYYAKSRPVECLKKHTYKLLLNLKLLKKIYGKEIEEKVYMKADRFWYLMGIICKYHDIGKVFTGFQNEIRKNIGLSLISTNYDYSEIKHEQISSAFLPEFDLTKEEKKLVYQSIYYHHERENKNMDVYSRNLLKEIIEEDIKPNLSKIKKELQIEIGDLDICYLNMVGDNKRICEGDELYNDYCIMKGLLHRLDHCSSADIGVEDDTSEEISSFVENKFKLNQTQSFTKENQNNNLVIVGSTGIGKTESALVWVKNDKTFFTLPLRISINAIYDRILNSIGYRHVGLLHSTAIDYLENKFDNELEKINQSKNLSEKITTCTIDQIFPFVFKYRGYEKMYATLSYSKVVIDEIQAYSPEIVAIILKGLEMINKIGGKFMIMTATLPRIYKEELEKMKIPFKYNKFLKETKRHKIKLEEKQIEEDIDLIVGKSKKSKVLVIVNTVNKAIELYLKLKENQVHNLNLLHSRFILQDRNEKEEKIKEFSKKENSNGIWITTQIVEASLDIDFDYLFTEMSTLDSLFQRLGRCYRNRQYEKEECNVIIYTKNASGIKYIYDKEIHNKSIEFLKDYDNTILDEETKIDLVDKLYSKEVIEKTEFYKRFKEGKRVLQNLIDYSTSKKDAQKLLRKIDNINVIPMTVYNENIDLFKEFELENDYHKKNEVRREIGKLLTSINRSNYKDLMNCISECPYCKKDIYIIDTRYDNEIGLLLEKDEEYDLDSRIL